MKPVEIFITGGIGSGKTTLAKEICAIAEKLGFETFTVDCDSKIPNVTECAIKRAIEKSERRILIINETLMPVEIRRNQNDKTVPGRT